LCEQRLPTKWSVDFAAAVLDDPAMSAEKVALIARCIECGDLWLPVDEARWRAYLDADDNLVFYCAGCAEREFDPD
jgi:hypothetical protein